MSTCPVHRVLARLRTFAGLPVPHSVKWIDDKPDFRQIDLSKWTEAVKQKLCGVCGQPLGEKCYWVGGSRTLRSRFFTDLPMHQICAEESIKLCPFLNGTRKDYRGELKTLPHMVQEGRPARMFLMRGRTKDLQFADLDGYLALYAGKSLQLVREF